MRDPRAATVLSVAVVIVVRLLEVMIVSVRAKILNDNEFSAIEVRIQ